MVLIMMELHFLYQKKTLVKLKLKATFALMFSVMKTNYLSQFTFQIKYLKI